MIVLFEGPLGSGKSLCATAFSVMEYYESFQQSAIDSISNELVTGRKIISNTRIYGVPTWEQLTYETFVSWMKEETELKDAIVILDEAYLFVDSRLSSSALSRLMSYFFLQTRKRHVDLFVCSQQYENVDIRLRRNIDVRAICRMNKNTGWCKIRFINMRTGKKRNIQLYGPDFYSYFDTNEIPHLRPAHTDIKL